MVFAFNFNLLDRLNKDVWLGHVDHCHCQPQIPIDEAIVAVIEALSLDRARQDLEGVVGVLTCDLIYIPGAIENFRRVNLVSICINRENCCSNITRRSSIEKIAFKFRLGLRVT